MAISNSSSGIRPGVCTSSTRPTTPYVGQLIFETDTSLSKYWSGSAWTNLSVSSLTAGTGVTVSSATGAVTASIGQSVATTATPTFGNITASGSGDTSIRINSTSGYAIQYFSINGTNRWHYEVTPSYQSWALVESGVAQRMTVNAGTGNLKVETGQIITPNQYCYNGDNTAGTYTAYNGTPVIPPTTYLNVGSAFNTGNGRFTVPVAGYVLCSFNSLIQRNATNAAHAYTWFAVDGVRKSATTHTVYDIGGNYQSLNNTAIVYCSANSYVTCILTTPQASAYTGEYGLGLTYRFLG